MAIVSVGELLDRAREFEDRVEKYYAAIRDQTSDNGAKLLTYYLSRHRRHLAEALKDFTSGQIEQIRKTQLKYDIEFHAEKQFHVLNTPPAEVNGQQLLEAAVAYDTELISLYGRIREQPLDPETTVLFDSLIRLEERDIVMLKKMIAMHYF